MEQKIPLRTVFSIAIGDGQGAPPPPIKPRAIVSEVSYHKEQLLASRAAKLIVDGVLTPEALCELNSLQGTPAEELRRGYNLDMSNLGITSLDGFDGLDVRLRHLSAGGNALFLEQLVDFAVQDLDLGQNDIGDEVLWNFLSILAGRGQPGPQETEIPIHPEGTYFLEGVEPSDAEKTAESFHTRQGIEEVDILDDKFLDFMDPSEGQDAGEVGGIVDEIPVGVGLHEGEVEESSNKQGAQTRESAPELDGLAFFAPPAKRNEPTREETRPNRSAQEPLYAAEELSGASVRSAGSKSQAERQNAGRSIQEPPMDVRVTLEEMLELAAEVAANQQILAGQFRLFRALESLDLSGNPCGNPVLLSAVLNLFPRLQKVTLSGMNFLQIDGAVTPVHGIRDLTFSNAAVDKRSLVLLNRLFPGVTHLGLQGIECGPEVLSGVRLFSQLEELDLTDVESLRDLGLLKAFVRGCNLSGLRIINCQRSTERNLKPLATAPPSVYFHLDAAGKIMGDTHNAVSKPINSRYFQTQRIVEVKLHQQQREMGSRLSYGQMSGKLEAPRTLDSRLKLSAPPRVIKRSVSEQNPSHLGSRQSLTTILEEESAKAPYKDNEIVQQALSWFQKRQAEAVKGKKPTEPTDGNGDQGLYFLTEVSAAPGVSQPRLFSKETYVRTLASLDIDGGPTTEEELLKHPLDFSGLGALRRGEKSNVKQLYTALRNALEFPPSAAARITDEEMLESILAEHG